MDENSIQHNEKSYLLYMMNSEISKKTTKEDESNIVTEYGENDLKEILLAEIRNNYIKKKSDTSS